MKCCFICQHYQFKMPDGSPICVRHQKTPLSESAAKKAGSLRELSCHPKSRAFDHFQRAELEVPNLPGEPLYCCCPGLLDLVEKKHLTASRGGGPTSQIEYQLVHLAVQFCPCCGERLQLAEEVKARMEKMRKAR